MQSKFNVQRELLNQVVCGRVLSPSFYPHFHSHIEIYLVLSGEIEILVNDQKKLLGAGEMAVALSYDTHGYQTPKEAEAIYLIIPTAFFEEFLPLISARYLPSPYLHEPSVFQTVRNAMEGLLAGGNEITQRGYLYAILGAVFDCMIPKSGNEKITSHRFSAEILIYLSDHFREELTLTDVAKEFGYNSGYLSRSFRQAFGISFVHYLTMLRLREAVLLLRSEKHTVTECAIDSGFGSMRSFYRAFYEEFGCSPKEYLKRDSQKGTNRIQKTPIQKGD